MSVDEQQTILHLAEQAGIYLSQQGLMLVTAESCTGGGLGQAITSVSGCSAWYERGFITYSNRSKQDILGVSNTTLEQFGTVSEQTAQEMVIGAINRSQAQIGVSITGIAGPDGGTPSKPIGMICFTWAIKEGLMRSETQYFTGDRAAIRHQSIINALQGVIDLLYNTPPAVA